MNNQFDHPVKAAVNGGDILRTLNIILLAKKSRNKAFGSMSFLQSLNILATTHLAS